MKTNRKLQFSVLGAVVLLLAFAGWTNASTINGIANQIISGLSVHNVLLGGGTADIVQVAPSATVGFPLLSNGTSADPSFGQVPNAGLANSTITFAASGCISASGAVALGGTLTFTNTCVGFTGTTSTTPGATPTWTLASGDVAWTLSANATATVTVAAGDQWFPHTIQICQPAAGGPFTFAWPANVKGGMTIGTTANKCNVQSFKSYDGINLTATSVGIINE